MSTVSSDAKASLRACVMLRGVRVIEDPVEARQRIERFLERAGRRDAYGELLARGQVSRKLGDPEARSQLRICAARRALTS